MVKQANSVDIRLRLEAIFRRNDVSARNRPTFEQIWQTYRVRVWGLTARLAGNRDTADDLTQEIAVQALRGYDTFRGDADPMTWLFRIAIHTVMRHREKMQTRRSSVSLNELERNESLYLLAPPAEQPENLLLATEAEPDIRDALESLPEELRTTMILYIYEEMKCREIAEALGIPLGTVLSRLYTARQRMKSLLGKENNNGC